MRKIERTHSWLKKKAWNMFSKYKRLKECLETTGTPDWGICYTCKKRFHFKDLQCGHFVRGRGAAVLFDEGGTRIQCVQCNIFKDGEALIFRMNLVEEVGEDVVKILENKRWIEKKHSKADLEGIYLAYKQLYEQLQKAR